MLATFMRLFNGPQKMTEIDTLHGSGSGDAGSSAAEPSTNAFITSAPRAKRKATGPSTQNIRKRKRNCQEETASKSTEYLENQENQLVPEQAEDIPADEDDAAPKGFLGSVLSPVYMLLHLDRDPVSAEEANDQPDGADCGDCRVEQEDEAGTSSSEDTAVALNNFNESSENVAPEALQPIAAEQVEEEEEEECIDFDPFVFIRNLPPLEVCIPKYRNTLLPKQTRQSKRKTLVLDLDETLVHSSLDAVVQPDFTFLVHFNNQEHLVRVKQRPHLMTFMERCAELFEVVVFTASQKVYAEKLLSIVDPDRKLVKHKIYRDSCVIVDGNYLKDLSILGRDLRHTLIVDNSPQAFGFQVENGIPIESWYDDENDQELLKLLPFLESLVDAEDVRPLIEQKYRLRDFIQKCQDS